MYSINLRYLFTKSYNQLPDFIESTNVIYRIHNLVNNKSYIGQARNFYDRFVRGYFSHKGALIEYSKIKGYNYYLYNALRKYHCKNFEVEIIDQTEVELLNEHEIYWIKYYDSFNSGYNMTSGGQNCEQLWKGAKLAYPELNGMNPNCLHAARLRRLELYPDTNGVPYEFIDSGHSAQVAQYPDTNGASPQFIKAGHEACIKYYPETNGAPIEMLHAGLKARADKYGMNGMTQVCIDAGLQALRSKYPETNGANPEWIKAGNDASRRSKIITTYNAVIKMCDAFRKDGGTKFRKSIYWNYKISGSPQPYAYRMRSFFANCKEFDLDTSGIIDLFPDNWIN